MTGRSLQFVYLMMTNVMMKTFLNQKIIKNSNLIIFKQSRVAYVRNRKLSEGRIFPKAEFLRIFTECSEVRIEHTR